MESFVKKPNQFLAIVLVALSSNNYSAIENNKGTVSKNAQACFGCHGENGVSTIPSYPNLAGQKQKYIENQLFAYREGKRTNEIMSPMAKSLSDKDILSLSEYFSNLPIKN